MSRPFFSAAYFDKKLHQLYVSKFSREQLITLLIKETGTTRDTVIEALVRENDNALNAYMSIWEVKSGESCDQRVKRIRDANKKMFKSADSGDMKGALEAYQDGATSGSLEYALEKAVYNGHENLIPILYEWAKEFDCEKSALMFALSAAKDSKQPPHIIDRLKQLC